MKHKSKEEEKIEVQTELQETECTDCGDEEAKSCKEAEETSELDELKNRLEQKCREAEENFNKFARMQADFDNYKKRIAREREELYYSLLEGIIKELLPVVDNMERAVAAMKNDSLESKYVDGIDMVCKQLLGVLDKNGVKEIDAMNKEFDPNLHHAVMQVEAEGEDANTIKEIFQKGYMLGSKVVRPTLVKVAVSND
ncbi:MAG: nucleotide exchange factor GrpE [Bacillota bacterium]